MRLEYFQMIDRVVAFDDTARTIACRSTVPDESPVFEGHFPGHPLVPGVLLIETMAQASGYLALGLNRFSAMPFLAGVKEAKLRSFIPPTTPIEIAATLAHEGSGYAVTTARITQDGKRVCDAELMFRLMPFPSEAFATMMRDQAARLGMASLS
ncbi:MAG: 3-hydroxyacyl-ACP dehydratase FabZ family protein [Labrys sp. (in: a-proteobacteria)]|jgi:3-hydroxyacyl-[acyl-carrier-protein] dehydratase